MNNFDSTKKRIGVLISGNGTNLQALIDAQSNGELFGEVVFVLSNNPNAFGLQRAKAANIAYKVINHKDFADRAEFDRALITQLQAQNLDLIVLAGFMRILTKEFIDAFSGKIVNIHPSLLPSYKGLDTHARVLQDGAELHGCSIHFVNAELDSGLIIARAILKVNSQETADELEQRVHKLEHLLYPKVVSWIMQNRLKNIDGVLYLDDKKISETGIDFKFY